jgi:Flp pilus assembly protein TadD
LKLKTGAPATYNVMLVFSVFAHVQLGSPVVGRKFILCIALLLSISISAAGSCAQTRAQSDGQPENLLADAKSRFLKGNLADADRTVRLYLESHPNSSDAHFLLGHILFREIQSRAAIERQLQSQAPNPAGAKKAAGSGPSDPPGSKATQEMAKASLAEFTAGAKFGTPSAGDLKTVAFNYILLGDLADADKWLTKMLDWAPDDWEGWYHLGRTKYNENRFDEAISVFQRCLKLNPHNVQAEDNLGLSLAGLGRNDDAAVAYHQAIAWQAQSLTKDPGPYIDLGSLLIDQNRANDSVPFLLQAVEIAPAEWRAHELLATAYTRAQEFPRAQSELEKAIELSPQTANLHCMLAPIYHKQGLTEKAKAEYDQCAALSSSDSTPEPPRQ